MKIEQTSTPASADIDFLTQKITDNLEVITGGKIDELKRIYEESK